MQYCQVYLRGDIYKRVKQFADLENETPEEFLSEYLEPLLRKPLPKKISKKKFEKALIETAGIWEHKKGTTIDVADRLRRKIGTRVNETH
ncbi:hypothetical protein HUU42_01720 [bacterium]|nr:hypothetical protein [bacterium]